MAQKFFIYTKEEVQRMNPGTLNSKVMTLLLSLRAQKPKKCRVCNFLLNLVKKNHRFFVNQDTEPSGKPKTNNAGGIAKMAGMIHRICERTDARNAAGNTTAAIGKDFVSGSTALVSLALFGAFVSRAGISTVDVLTPQVFIGLIVGAMLPYWFSAMSMKSVGSAALKMLAEVRRPT